MKKTVGFSWLVTTQAVIKRKTNNKHVEIKRKQPTTWMASPRWPPRRTTISNN